MKSDQNSRRHYLIAESKQYRRDVRRLVKSGFDLRKLNRVIDALAQGKALGAAYRDHALQGKLTRIRECHVSADWLLLYQRDEGRLVLLLIGTGTHATMFGK